MNKREFKKVMEVFNLIPVGNVRFNGNNDFELFNFGGIHLFCDSDRTAHVIGLIPHELIEEFQNKYPSGIFKSYEVKEAETDIDTEEDRLALRLAKPHISGEKYWIISDKNYKASQSRNPRRETDIWFSTKEMLIKFMAEYEDYLLRTRDLPATEVSNVENTITEANKRIFSYPQIPSSISEFMDGDFKGKEKLAPFVTKTSSDMTEEEQKFIANIMAFDKAVNPFLQDDISNEDIIENFRDRTVVFNNNPCYKDFGPEFNLMIMVPTKVKLDTSFDYDYTYSSRDPNGLTFVLVSGMDEEGRRMYVTHSYIPNEEKEEIYIEYTGEDSYDAARINLSSANGFIERNATLQLLKDPQALAMVNSELEKATKLASEISMGNIIKRKKELKNGE